MTWNANWIYWGLLLIFIPIMVSHMSVEISRIWFDHRSRSQVLDLLRSYAEKGQEPPASVVEALIAVSSRCKPSVGVPGAAAPAPTRAHHMARVATNIVGALGWAWIAWWRLPDHGDPGALVIIAIVCAIFCTGLLAAHLVGVFTTPSGS
jgi:hypothetical protein